MVMIENLRIETPAFGNQEQIPVKHTGEGTDVSPTLSWTGVPAGTQEIAVICHDPDAPTPDGFTHWLVYGIPADVDSIPEGGGDPYNQGVNDFGNQRYNGPMPPPGHGVHHYYYWVYALDRPLGADPGLTRAELIATMAEHVIEQARLVGTYERS